MPRLRQAALDHRRARRHLHPQRLEDIRASRAARHGPVSVFGDAHAAASHDDRRAGRDVERSRPVAARPARVEHHRVVSRTFGALRPSSRRARASSAPARRSRRDARPSSTDQSAGRRSAPARRALPSLQPSPPTLRRPSGLRDGRVFRSALETWLTWSESFSASTSSDPRRSCGGCASPQQVRIDSG